MNCGEIWNEFSKTENHPFIVKLALAITFFPSSLLQNRRLGLKDDFLGVGRTVCPDFTQNVTKILPGQMILRHGRDRGF